MEKISQSTSELLDETGEQGSGDVGERDGEKDAREISSGTNSVEESLRGRF